MYKLVLCLRYLRRRAIAYFAVLGVALCVAMLLIVTSVMTGFVNKIERAARGLFGDVVLEPYGQAGMPRYDDLIRRIVEDVDRVEAASPRIYSYGVLLIPGQADYRMLVQIAGILLGREQESQVNALYRSVEAGSWTKSDRSRRRVTAQATAMLLELPRWQEHQEHIVLTDVPGHVATAAEVTDFEDGLFVQEGLVDLTFEPPRPIPTFDPPRELMAERVSAHIQTVRAVADRERDGRDTDELPEATGDLLVRLANAQGYLRGGLENIELAEAKAEALEYLLAALNEVNSAGGDFSVLKDNIAELAELLVQAADSPGRYGVLGCARREMGLAAAMTDITRLEDVIEELEAETIEPWPHRVILGLGIDALSFRTRKGDTVRIVGPGSKITLYVFPIGKQLSLTDVSPNVQRLTVVDDCTTDVASIDSKTVYLPFAELQRLNDMGELAYQGGLVGPARCSQIQIKVRSDVTSETELQEVCDEINAVWRQFKRDYSESYPNDFPNVLTISAEARTWRERQIDLISMIETQRTLMIVMFGIISLVSVVLVFVIFYMIVVQKTRDIGVLKAIGASSPGVAGIFLAYGAVIGLVGSIIGSIGGYIFVRNINGIRNWLSDDFGFRPWTRERFMFAEIPNEVDPWTVLIIIVCAIAAGVLGAVVPAIRAARMQPVEALRYE